MPNFHAHAKLGRYELIALYKAISHVNSHWQSEIIFHMKFGDQDGYLASSLLQGQGISH